MKCLVLVKFLPGGSLDPEEFLSRINSQWSWIEENSGELFEPALFNKNRTVSPRAAMCITEYDSVQQLSIDLSIMPGAGISNVEVIPISEAREHLKPEVPISD
jgi:hypothetical protein